MTPADPISLPEDSLLAERQRRGSYADSFSLVIDRPVTLAAFIEAFYTTRLFKAERLVLRVLAGRGSSDAQAQELAAGTRDRFAVWRVDSRTEHEILLTDETGSTSSWLMVTPEHGADPSQTRLYFGSAVRPRSVGADGQPRFSPVFHALLGAHERYSRRLLQAAAARLRVAARVAVSAGQGPAV